jgi:putative membrane protein
MQAVLAQMMDRDAMGDGGGHWWAWLIGAVVLVVLVGLIVFALVRMMTTSNTSGTPGVQSRRSAEDLLAERFARGEIDEDEYRRRRDALRD